MCIITKGAILWLVAGPLPTIGAPIPGALQTHENAYVFDDQGICERSVAGAGLICAPIRLVTCPSERKRK